MKRLLCLTFAVGLVVCGAAAANAANLLANPDLDNIAISGQVLATPVSWTAAASKSISGAFNDGMSSEGFANVFQPAGGCQGSGCGLFFKPFQGNITTGDLVDASLSQDVPGTAGAKYTLTGWAGSDPNYIGLTDPTVKSQFVLQFLNGANAVVGTSTLDLAAAGLRTSGLPNPFGYNTYSVSGVAPGGTVTVRSIVQMLNAYSNPAGGGQAFVVDSFDLEKGAVPEPATLAMGLIAVLGGVGLIRRRG